MFFSKKAQGTIEYLIIIAVIVVIGLVVVGLTMELFDNQQIGQSLGQIKGQTGTSGITIMDSVAGLDSDGLIILKNTNPETLTINTIIIDDEEHDYDYSLPMGSQIGFKLENIASCDNETKNYTIIIEYTTNYGLEKTINLGTTTINCVETTTPKGNIIEKIIRYSLTPNCTEILDTYSGSGEPENPYEIENLYQLQCIKDKNLLAHYKLVNNIDASPTTEWNNGEGFEPIGDYTNNQFEGDFNGSEYNITGLYINRTTDFVGLFGSSKGKILNVGLIDINITGSAFVGGIIGFLSSFGTISNSFTTGSVIGTSYNIGGLTGRADWLVSNSYSTANVTGSSSVGGVVGSQVQGTISNSFATGNITGGGSSGGLVGSTSGTISNSFATGNINGSSAIGGLTGYLTFTGKIYDSYSIGNTTRTSGASSLIGGFVGYNDKGKIFNSYSTGAVYQSPGILWADLNKGFAGSVNTDGGYEMSGNFWDTETSEQTTTSGNATGKTTLEMKTITTFTNTGWDITKIEEWNDNNWLIGTMPNYSAGETYPILGWE
ncbi:MAG: GLUG motif-containing protein [Candidatus ainarchaeum sp.]|nr:GLUG motif-containing protein [Candidatus ainarchaeum sp.]